MIQIDLQNDQGLKKIPALDQFQTWVQESLQQNYSNLEQTIRIVTESESQTLNHDYRGKDNATNILSFPADSNEYLDYTHLGDLVICAAIVETEAQQQGKHLNAHWAHMVVHGMLHLQGFDHQNDEQARQMEALEIEIMAALGHTNPYSSELTTVD